MVWIPSWTFQRASFSFQWWWMQSFWRWIPSAPSISSWERFWWVPSISSPVSIPIQPSHAPAPQIETTSMRVWVDYQGNGFGNRAETTDRMANKFRKIPNITPELVSTLSNMSTDLYFEEIELAKKNPNNFAFLDMPLPEWVEWKDLNIQVTWNGWNNAKNWTADLYLYWKRIKLTNFHELELEDTVRWGVSKSWRILLFLALKWTFEWETELIPWNIKKAKERFSDDLKKIFWLSSDPIKNIGNRYLPLLTIGINHNLLDTTKEETLEEIFN